LVEAFQATLQEATDADLLLHVVDAANLDWPEQMAEVQKVLTEIGADMVPQLLVFNKLDALDAERYPLQLQDQYEMDGQPVPRVFLSAQSGKGLDVLRSALSEIVITALPFAVAQDRDPRDMTREYSGDLH
jgi:GTP-binding protein HflX